MSLVKTILRSFLLFILLVSHDALPTLAQVAETDFDQDGRSELTLVTIGNRGSLSWSNQNSVTGVSTHLGELGQAGQHLSLANWLGSPVPEIGVVYFNGAKGSVVWKIKDDTGAIQKREFGSRRSLALSGGDFNGDGYVDGAVAKLKGSRVEWRIAYDLFLNADPAVLSEVQFPFGSKSSRFFFASPDGTHDWLAYMSFRPGKTSLIRFRNLITGKVRTTTRIPKWALRTSSVRPFPVRRSDGKDILAFSKSSSSRTGVEFRTVNGGFIYRTILNGTGDLVVGDFLPELGEEVALKGADSTNVSIINPLGKTVTLIGASAGIAVDSININLLRGRGSGGGGGSSDDDDSTDDIPIGEVGNCQALRSWPGSHIYKIFGSDHFSPGDPRKNSAGVIIEVGGPGPFPDCLAAQDLKGNIIARLGLYARGDGWAARYYAGWGCGAGTPLGGSEIGSRARARTGSSSIVVNFGSVCYGPIDATHCIGSSQC